MNTKDDPNGYTEEEREAMLLGMRAASGVFYAQAFRIGCHPFIEFCGLMNEYIQMCERAHKGGLDFPHASAHSGISIPMATHEAAYLGEKLGCIYGPALQDPANLRAFLRAAGLPASEREP